MEQARDMIRDGGQNCIIDLCSPSSFYVTSLVIEVSLSMKEKSRSSRPQFEDRCQSWNAQKD